ncbi:hypothetical protein SPRG_07099 [Saprolegnia parasitica CBS 223.65]|uniref:Uncharacterized protein n=1 Tax=Saprolegnia parasitica (strain CBS 223.65) TaxID=695850 RepID=A0A067CMR7_SAPPC|nr:hypothetical protein SPRG_07099 [Saprolegnia parasitica CBS 223.65]KDO27826.1 hypothetical protein SPRG_07099 [Saprolegnia parasitica CBS 223.65]|eukprot:XP_012201286.1 hypothetical protein SPRG_07099 [Saprolegnia parasitica CBS 223.65]
MASAALYKAAFEKHLQSQSYVFRTKPSPQLSPTVALDGVDGHLAEPWTPTQEQQLTALHTNIVPAAKITILNAHKWSKHLETRILPALQRALRVKCHVRVVLSHLCIDSVGTTLAPTPEIPHAVGTLLVSFKSTYTGGELTFTNGTDVLELTASQQAVQTFASFNHITSAPITSGCRVALVYALTSDPEAWVPPPTRNDVIEAFAAIARDPPHDIQRIARAVHVVVAYPETLSFQHLKCIDKTLVDILVATNGYDISLVDFQETSPPTPDVYGGYDFEDDSWDEDPYFEYKVRYENCVTRIQSLADIPFAVTSGVRNKGADLFLSVDASANRSECPATAVLFWPKRCRVAIAGPSRAVSLLKEAIRNGQIIDLFGLSLHDFILGTLTAFDVAATNNSDAVELGYLLLRYKDAELLKRFLRNTLSLSTWRSDGAAQCLHESLETFGWPTLLPAVEAFLARVVKKYDGTHAICRLLASLAGLTTEREAVCPPLNQPFAGEFLKACWQAALMEPHFKPGDAPTEHSILLDWYFDTGLPTRPGDNYLGQWLPPPVLLMVDSFLYSRRVGAPSALTAAPSPWHQLKYLPKALLAAIPLQPSLQQAPYVAAIKTALTAQSKGAHLSAYEIAALLQYMEVVGGFDATLLATSRAFARPITDILPAILMFVQRAPLSTATGALVTSFLLDFAPTLEHPRRDSYGKSPTSSVADLLSALVIVSPKAARKCAAEWRSALPGTLDATRDELWPLVEELRRQVSDARFRELLVYLASECRAAFVSGGALAPLPAFTDYAFTDIEIDAAHCGGCADFRRFLRTGCDTVMTIEMSLCLEIECAVQRHPQQLELERDYEGELDYFILRKRTQPGMASTGAAEAHSRREDVRWNDIQRVKQLNALLADLTPNPSGVEIAHSATGVEDHVKAIELISMAIAVRPGHARYFLARGNSFRAINEFEAAISDFDMAISLDDKCPTYYASRGTCFRKLGRAADALEDFTLAIEYDTKRGTHYFNRALVLYDINHYELAISDFTKALDDASGGPRTEFRALHSRGNCYRRLGLFDKCVDDMMQAIKLEPRNSAVYNSLAQCYMEYHDVESAIKHFSTAITLLDSNPAYYNNRGQAYFEKGHEYDRMALADFHLAIKLDGKDAQAYYNRGLTRIAVALEELSAQESANQIARDLLLRSEIESEDRSRPKTGSNGTTAEAPATTTGAMSIFEQLEAALADMDMACSVVPESPRYLFGKAMVMHLKRHPQQTQLFLEMALQLDPAHVASKYHIGLLQHESNQHEAAIATFTAAIHDLPSEPAFLAARALVFQDVGLHELAIEDYSSAIAVAPLPDALHVYHRGESHLRLSHFDAAVADLSLALTLGASGPGVYNARGLAHRGLGLYELAIADLSSCVELNKREPSFRLHRAICYLECREYPKAHADLAVGLKLAPGDPRLLFHAGMVLFHRLQFPEAILQLRSALAHAPSVSYLSEIHYYIGLSYASIERCMDAIESFTDAIATAPDERLVYYHERAKALQLERYYDEAIEDFSRVLQGNPTNAHAAFRRGFAFKALGRHAEAAADIQKARLLDPTNPRLMVNFKELHGTDCIVLCAPGHEKTF